MKVVLGWVEGMADKVQGIQAGQSRMAQQVASQREEQQFALNATARETISKVKGMLVQQQTTAMAPPTTPATAFGGTKPISRPTTTDTARGGPVVLKAGGGAFDEGGGSAASAAVSAAAALADESAGLDAEGRRQLLEGAALAGPAGPALAGAVPQTGVRARREGDRTPERTARARHEMRGPPPPEPHARAVIRG